MNIKQRFAAQKTWIRGGIMGLAVCALLFGFYLFIFFPTLFFIRTNYPTAENTIERVGIIVPTATGHSLPFLMHFFIEGTSFPAQICTETETNCVRWSLEYEAGGIPLVDENKDRIFTDPEDGAGYCLQQETRPLPECTDRVELAATLLAFSLLEAVYFIIGAVIAIIVERRRITK